MTIPVLLHADCETSGNETIFRLTVGTDRTFGDIPGKSSNVTPGGLLIEGDFPFELGSRLLIAFDDCDPLAATVIWANHPCWGCQFDEEISPASVASLLSAAVSIADNVPDDRLPSDSAVGFGANLRRLREARGVSRRVLAEKMGVSLPTVSFWESDMRRPVIGRLNRICEILGVTVDELMRHEDSQDLADILSHSRERIARFLGTSPDSIRIMIEI